MSDVESGAIPDPNAYPSTVGVRALAELCADAGVEEIQASDGAWSVRLRLDSSAQPDDAPRDRIEVATEPTGPYIMLSQWVGVFHRAADAGARSYVEEGQSVTEGDIVGVVAAMQLQHEVHVDRAGTLERFLIQDGTAIEYGQPLLEIS